MDRKRWLLFAIVALMLFAVESVAVHQIYASRFLGGNDFYPRWAGARALFLEGRDPYAPELTEEISAVLDPMGRGTNSFSFAYPLHVIFLLLPLAFLQYSWAYAIWMVTVQWAAFILVATLLAWKEWQPSPLAAAGLLVGSILFYPIARSILLGQFTVHVTLFIALTLLALHRGRDGWAGVFLAATSIKPQMVIFLAPWLLLWAASKRRWRFHRAFIAAGIGYFLAALLLFPRWPISFLEDIPRYSASAGGRDPLAILSNFLLPGAGAWLKYIFAGLLLAVMLLAWRRGWQREGLPFQRAVSWTILVNLLVPFQTGSTGQVMLVIPFFLWLTEIVRRRGRLPAIILAGVVLFGAWGIFILTFSGESAVMFWALPSVALLVLTARELSERGRSAVPVGDTAMGEGLD